MENSPRTAQGGQVFDLVVTVACDIVASGFIARGAQLIEQHAPEAGVAAVGLGVVALFFTGVSIYHFDRFLQPRPPA
jgi:hypothetical protein